VRFVIFTHSLISDWNHGNAHFLRGMATELAAAGHKLRVFEPRGGWSLRNYLTDGGDPDGFRRAYPLLESEFYDPDSIDLDEALAGASVVLVHEWNPHGLVRRIGEHRARRGCYQLFFHDTHHRSATDPSAMAAYDLSRYDGVLAYGGAIRDLYRANGWAQAAWTWHEAADTRVFRPIDSPKTGDVVWIGNWGDGERTEELREFLIGPVEALGLKARVYGVRYPKEALAQLAAADIEYGGWLPNYRVPEVFAQHRVTLHIPRRPYTNALPGIPTIRPFEAMACGIPLISAPWNDCEGLFRPGRDLLYARNAAEVIAHLRAVLSDSEYARSLAASGLETIRARHTCAHRAAELLDIIGEIGIPPSLRTQVVAVQETN
jgi:spore maturation protein CgeB